MGLFFENIHIHKNTKYDTEVLKKELIKYFEEKGFLLSEEGEDGSASVVIYEPDGSNWVSVASDIFQLETLEEIRNVSEPLSKCLETEVLTAGCYDSDYLRLSILNICDGTDGWINVGETEGMKKLRRTGITPWKKVVADIDALKNIVKAEYVFAEDAFYKIAELIHMLPEQVALEVEYTNSLTVEKMTTLKFSAPKGTLTLPELMIPLYDLMPCKIGKHQVVSVYNRGGKAKGLGIMFVGDYVENDEITFENVKLQFQTKEGWQFVPIELKKVNQTQEKKCYYWSDAEFPLPPAVNIAIPLTKRRNLEFQREIGIVFTPVGNPRKVLDIKLVVFPLANRMEGQTSWYVYRYDGSKRKYIEEHNKDWMDIVENLLNPDDYDLD